MIFGVALGILTGKLIANFITGTIGIILGFILGWMIATYATLVLDAVITTVEFYVEDSAIQKKMADLINCLIEKKLKYYRLIALILFAALLIEVFYILFSFDSFSFEVTLFILALITFCLVKKWILSYRVKHGFFSSCAEEARELIYFMLEEQDKGGKNGKMKLHFPKEELEELVVKEPAGGEVHV